MQILNYVKSLLSHFNKERVQEDINICRNEMQNTTIVMYQNAEGALKNLQSKEAKEFEKQWFTYVKNAKRGSLVSSIHGKLEECLPTLDMLDKLAEARFEDEIMTAGMTISKATSLRLVEVAGFISTYALRFLNYVYVLETTAVTGQAGYVGQNLTPGEITMIKNHFPEFCLAIAAFAREPKSVEKTLDSIPEILVSERGESALKVFGEAKVDPLGVFRVKGFTYNPIYHVGLLVAEMQANRYKRAKELKSVLELRLLNLQQQQSGSADATLDREIEIIQSRIDSLDEKIRKAEGSVQ